MAKKTSRKFTAEQRAKLSLLAFIDANRPLIDALRKDPRKLRVCKKVFGVIIKEAPNTDLTSE